MLGTHAVSHNTCSPSPACSPASGCSRCRSPSVCSIAGSRPWRPRYAIAYLLKQHSSGFLIAPAALQVIQPPHNLEKRWRGEWSADSLWLVAIHLPKHSLLKQGFDFDPQGILAVCYWPPAQGQRDAAWRALTGDPAHIAAPSAEQQPSSATETRCRAEHESKSAHGSHHPWEVASPSPLLSLHSVSLSSLAPA